MTDISPAQLDSSSQQIKPKSVASADGSPETKESVKVTPAQPNSQDVNSETENGDSNSPVSTVPAWFLRKQSKSSAAVPPLPSSPPKLLRRRRVRIVPIEDEELTTVEELAESLKGRLGAGLGISMAVHFVIILLFAFWALDIEQIIPDILLVDGSHQVGADVELQDDPTVALVVNSGGQEVEEKKPFQPRNFLPKKDIDLTIPAEITTRLNKSTDKGSGQGESSGNGAGNGAGSVPSGGPKKGRNAVTRGSFTVWTIPDDPAVRQNYLIVIRVRVPKSTKLIRINDLNGTIRGDKDNHLQHIPFDRNWGSAKIRNRRRGPAFLNLRQGSFIPLSTYKKRKYAQIYIWVPGSEIPKTTDTIDVKSKLLNESQTIKIVF